MTTADKPRWQFAPRFRRGAYGWRSSATAVARIPNQGGRGGDPQSGAQRPVTGCRGYLSWSYREWGVKALIALGRADEALLYAEASRGRNVPEEWIARAAEEIMLAAGRTEEAYQRFAFAANQGDLSVDHSRRCQKIP